MTLSLYNIQAGRCVEVSGDDAPGRHYVIRAGEDNTRQTRRLGRVKVLLCASKVEITFIDVAVEVKSFTVLMKCISLSHQRAQEPVARNCSLF